MAWALDPDAIAALERITEGLKAAKRTKRQGFNVQQVREILRQAMRAFKARDYTTATDLANRAIQLCALSTPSRF